MGSINKAKSGQLKSLNHSENFVEPQYILRSMSLNAHSKALNGHSKALNGHSKALNGHPKALNGTFIG